MDKIRKTSKAKLDYAAKKRQDPVHKAKQKEYMKTWLEKNKDKKKQADKEYQQKNSEKARLSRKKWKSKKYQEKIASLIADHPNVCDICGGPPDGRWNRLNIDHCHTEGHFRGMLCSKCNRGIGLFQDDVSLLSKAIAYLENAKSIPEEDRKLLEKTNE